MRTILLLSIFCLGAISLQAQRDETLFNNANSTLNFTGIWGSFGYNYSGFGDDWTYVRGGTIGLEYNRDFFIGYGGYRTRELAVLDNGNKNFDLRYRGLVLGFAPNSTKAVHPRINFLTGRGKVWTNENSDRDRVFVFQPSAGLEVNVFQWFRVGFDAGYRFVGNSSQHNLSGSDLSAPFAQIELRFGFSSNK